MKRVISDEHQRLVNALALALESQKGVRITDIDISGTPHWFDPKYRKLSPPVDCNGRIPDLAGNDEAGTIHLGEAETDMEAENINEQLKIFSNRIMPNTNIHVPLHVIVPPRIKSKMEARIRSLGLGDRLDSGQILIWS